MRSLISIFLSLCLSLNAASAVGIDICDAMAGGDSEGVHAIVSTHEEHIGHHVHNHDHALDVDNNLPPADQTASNTHSDHCHPHQCFTSVISDEVTLPSLDGMYLPPIGPYDRFVSIPLSRIERPPKSLFA